MITKNKKPDFSFESTHSGIVFGFDEAGRGPLVGPVVAACVYIYPENRNAPLWEQINDSKKLSSKKREILFQEIKNNSIWGIGEASAREIEEINILQASFLAMERAFFDGTNKDPCFRRECNKEMLALIDGNRTPKAFPCPVQTVIKGDSKSVSIAAASILAKVTRDHIMTELAQEYPHYGWEHNAGYPTPEHLTAIARHGITPHHRRSYAPVRDYIAYKKSA